ncbi:hypothetical protein HS7_11170 [Sulfolobales archaeon HS-7]|nr:hypothetical protein HS7_11170 [Sulfolobales archaeon HS-7]
MGLIRRLRNKPFFYLIYALLDIGWSLHNFLSLNLRVPGEKFLPFNYFVNLL